MKKEDPAGVLTGVWTPGHTSSMTTTQTRRPALAATMTATNGTVTVTITDQAGTVIDTVSTKESGKFLARLDKALTAKGFARTGYTATNGALVATLTDYRPF